MNSELKEQTNCRTCQASGLQLFLDLGKQPPANALPASANEKEPAYPLALCYCANCGLVQLTHVVDPNILFKNYFYFSSMSGHMKTHFAEYAEDVVKRFVPQNGLIVEIGSNDGILLSSLKDSSVRILGIDPAENVAEQARQNGIPTMTAFFCEETAHRIREEHGPASAIIANNVFAHIDDLDSVVNGVDLLLDKNGVFVIEAPYVVDLLENLEFDTVYHEHLSYLGVKPLVALFKRFGLEIFDVTRQAVHGGSIRVFVQRHNGANKIQRSVHEMIRLEENMGAGDAKRLNAFASRVMKLRDELKRLIAKIRSEGKIVAGYGAPAKGTVLLNYCSFGPEDISYLVDSTPAKQDRFVPGVKIQILPPEKLHTEKPDYALLLAWNHQNEILEKEKAFRANGGRFIIPIPVVKII